MQLSERDELVLSYLEKVKYIGWDLRSRLPKTLDMDDLVSCGILGLIEAAEQFDHDRQVQFSTFARYRVSGAMLDEIRRHARLLRDEKEDYTLNAESPSLSKIVECLDLIKRLPPRIAQVVHFYYYDGMTLDEIAEELMISPTLVWYKKNLAIKKMREILEPIIEQSYFLR